MRDIKLCLSIKKNLLIYSHAISLFALGDGLSIQPLPETTFTYSLSSGIAMNIHLYKLNK